MQINELNKYQLLALCYKYIETNKYFGFDGKNFYTYDFYKDYVLKQNSMTNKFTLKDVYNWFSDIDSIKKLEYYYIENEL